MEDPKLNLDVIRSLKLEVWDLVFAQNRERERRMTMNGRGACWKEEGKCWEDKESVSSYLGGQECYLEKQPLYIFLTFLTFSLFTISGYTDVRPFLILTISTRQHHLSLLPSIDVILKCRCMCVFQDDTRRTMTCPRFLVSLLSRRRRTLVTMGEDDT